MEPIGLPQVARQFIAGSKPKGLFGIRESICELDDLGVWGHLGGIEELSLGSLDPRSFWVVPCQLLHEVCHPSTKFFAKFFMSRHGLFDQIVEKGRAKKLFISNLPDVCKLQHHLNWVSDVGKLKVPLAELAPMSAGCKQQCAFNSLIHDSFWYAGKRMSRIFAAADIGSNTAHLLIAAAQDDLVTRIDNFNEWIPLGEIVARHGTIPKDMVSQLINAVREFKKMAAQKNAVEMYVFATEGMRMAQNYPAVLSKIEKETGIKVDIIAPIREAELSLKGVMLDCRHFRIDCLFEVGGGSAQIGRVKNGNLTESVSLPLGTGRIIAQSGLRNPCPDLAFEAASSYIEATLEKCTISGPSDRAVISGGVGRGLWRALHPDGEKNISRQELEFLIWSTRRLSIDRIIERFNVKPKRAGTLLPGALIYKALMDRFETDELIVSEFGIREGAMLEMAARRIKGCPV